MFTGIVEVMGSIEERRTSAGGAELRIRAPGLSLAAGESVAVDGACLTAVARGRGSFRTVLSRETLTRTRFARFRGGECVNLERSLAVGSRLGGHFVLGHVDTCGEVLGVDPDDPGVRLVVGVPRGYDCLIVEKGSLAVNGVSLTVADCRRGIFEVALIPFTLAATNLGRLRVGDAVHLEFDYLAKLLVKLAGGRFGTTPKAGIRRPTRRSA